MAVLQWRNYGEGVKGEGAVAPGRSKREGTKQPHYNNIL